MRTPCVEHTHFSFETPTEVRTPARSRAHLFSVRYLDQFLRARHRTTPGEHAMGGQLWIGHTNCGGVKIRAVVGRAMGDRF
jgi:hypothetical protein